MEQLQSSFNSILANLIAQTTLDDYISSCLYKNDNTITATKEIIDLLNDNTIIKEKHTLLNHITGKYLIGLHVQYMKEYRKINDENDNDEQMDESSDNMEFINSTLHSLFSLIDLCIYLDYEYDDYKSYAMHTFVHILSYLFPIDFIVSHFTPLFFKNETSDRRLLLTRGNKLQGKVKPGSRLIVIYKQLANRIPTYKAKNENMIAELRHFICNSFEISDKLSQSLDWHMPQSSLNGYYSVYKSYYEAKRIGQPNNHQRNTKSLFIDYITLMKTLTTHSESELIQSINKGPHSGNSSKLWLVDSISKGLTSIAYPDSRILKKIPLNDKSEKQFRWVMDEDIFMQQVKNYDFYWALKVQMCLITNFFHEFTVDKWRPNSEAISEEYSKFRKPDALINPITSLEGKKRISGWYNYSLTGFQSKKYHYQELLDILQNNERTFTKMKLKHFAHPDIDELSKISESKKRKLEEFMENSKDLDSSILRKKSKFVHKMGTPKITKLWNVKEITQIDEWKDSDDILETVKDDIYFARGNFQEDPKNVENTEVYTRLCWKGLRSVKECGDWLQLAETTEQGETGEGSGTFLF